MKRTLIALTLVLSVAAIVTIASLAMTLQSADAGKAWCMPC